jgi:hypothetical protein
VANEIGRLATDGITAIHAEDDFHPLGTLVLNAHVVALPMAPEHERLAPSRDGAQPFAALVFEAGGDERSGGADPARALSHQDARAEQDGEEHGVAQQPGSHGMKP